MPPAREQVGREKGDTPLPIKPVVLPSLPKVDDAQREKWNTDYDRVEGELLKPHLSGGTRTANLRNIPPPGSWDRTIPVENSMDVALERAAERARQRALAKKAHRIGLLNGTGPASPTMVAAAMSTTSAASAVERAATAPESSAVEVTRRPSQSKGAATQQNRRYEVTNASACLPNAPTRSMTPKQIINVLLTMLRPPLRFKHQCSVELAGIDLEWMMSLQSGDRPPALNTLDSVREDLFELGGAAKAREPVMNSPRSVTVMLRNGVTVDTLQQRPMAEFINAHGTEGLDAQGVTDVASVAHRHYESRRTKLLEALREEYHGLCAHTAMFELLEPLPEYRDSDFKPDATFLRNRMERQGHAAKINAERLERQLRAEQDMHRRMADAQARREASKVATEAARGESRMQAQERRKQAEMRMLELRKATQEINDSIRVAAEERRRREEEKEHERLAARAERLAREKSEADRINLEKQQRLSANKQLQLQKAMEEEQRALEKEAALEMRRRKQVEERDEARQAAMDAAAHAAEMRRQAKEKAAMHEAELQTEALRKQRAADDRLRAFEEEKRRQRMAQKEKDAMRSKRLQDAAAQANQNLADRAFAIQTRRAEHGQRSADMTVVRNKESALGHLAAALAADDKRFLVERQSRSQAFGRVARVAGITERERRAEAVERQRAAIADAGRHERELLRLQRESMRIQLDH